MSSDGASGAASAFDAATDLERHRSLLFGVAYRLLSSVSDADDVLQDAYVRWLHVRREQISEPRRYLTRIVTRLSIDRLRARAKRDTYIGHWLPEPLPTAAASMPSSATSSSLDPLETVAQRDSVATATLHLMERLDPVERAVYVLRQAFELPYAEIAETVELKPEHCRQLFRRASARVADDRRRFSPGRQEHARLLERFLDAARDGDLAGLRAVLRHDVVTWSDSGGKVSAARNVISGSERVSRFFAGIFGREPVEITLAEFNGSPGAVVRRSGKTQVVGFAVADGAISGVYLVSNPDKLAAMWSVV